MQNVISITTNYRVERCELALKYVQGSEGSGKGGDQLTYYRKRLVLLCDKYTYVDWNRIKKETSGQETATAVWNEIEVKLNQGYQQLFDKLNEENEDNV